VSASTGITGIPGSGNGQSAPDWRQSHWLAFAEFALVGLVFFLDSRHLIPLSKTPFLLALAWTSLRVRGLKWRDVGLSRYRNWKLTVAIGILAGALSESFQLSITQPLLATLTGKQPDLDLFQALRGNLKWTLIVVAFSWTLAAFGEEMVWRGYLMSRVAGLGNRTRLAWICSLLTVNAVFGLAHSYQGATGVIEEGFAGILLGLLYLGFGNLAIPIISHGMQDTIDALLIFVGKFPGM